ncbi:MAG: DUF302 domain-containing protein [Hyphomicrobiales bacterium]|nr:DUF302 domain-containing protein [Hyphomicrobiales bacterium]
MRTALLAALGLAGTIIAAPAMASDLSAPGITIYSAEASIDDVLLDISDAIVNRGYVVDYRSHVGEMLNRTAADVGADKTVYTAAVVTQFCSAVLSRKAMEADPVNLAFCPYGIFAFERADKPGTVYVGYRQLVGNDTEASKAALGEVNALLDSIAKEAVGAE